MLYSNTVLHLCCFHVVPQYTGCCVEQASSKGLYSPLKSSAIPIPLTDPDCGDWSICCFVEQSRPGSILNAHTEPNLPLYRHKGDTSCNTRHSQHITASPLGGYVLNKRLRRLQLCGGEGGGDEHC